MVWGRGRVGCIGVRALLLGLWPRLRVWHLVCKDKPHLGLWGERGADAEGTWVGLPPSGTFPLRTGRRRGKDLLGALSKGGDTLQELKMCLLIHLLERAQLEAIGKGLWCPSGCWPEQRGWGQREPRLQVCWEVAGLQMGARFPRTSRYPVAAHPFAGHVLFKSLEASSLKRGQERSVCSEAAGGWGLCGGRGPGGHYSLGFFCSLFWDRFGASFLNAALLVEFALSSREKCQASLGGAWRR